VFAVDEEHPALPVGVAQHWAARQGIAGLGRRWPRNHARLPHRASAALRAISRRSASGTPSHRALPPFLAPFLPQARMASRTPSGTRSFFFAILFSLCKRWPRNKSLTCEPSACTLRTVDGRDGVWGFNDGTDEKRVTTLLCCASSVSKAQ